MPAISVIVPIYKVESYLPECIDSILAQTFNDFELILVDDGSPDNCGKICDEYQNKDNRITVIHKENGGLSDARNKGIDIAKGEYLTFVDSDDLIHMDYLKTLYTLVNIHNCDISICSMQEFKDGTHCSLDSETAFIDEPIVLSGREACLHLYQMDGTVSVSACGKLYVNSLFKTLRFPFGRINEDQATTPIALYSSSHVVITSGRYYKYRNRATSIMHRGFNVRRFDDIYCTQICIDHFANAGDYKLAEYAATYKNVIHAKLVIEAISQNCKAAIPKEYSMSERKALRIMRENCTDDRYCWHLAKIHPNWLLPHAYLRKIKKILGIKCN